MTLRDLAAKFTQVLPLADGVYTGLCYLCPSDPRRKKAHAVVFDPPIIPKEYGAAANHGVRAALAANAHYSAVPKWTRTGETIDDLTLSPSIAQPCCHVSILNGQVEP